MIKYSSFISVVRSTCTLCCRQAVATYNGVRLADGGNDRHPAGVYYSRLWVRFSLVGGSLIVCSGTRIKFVGTTPRLHGRQGKGTAEPFSRQS